MRKKNYIYHYGLPPFFAHHYDVWLVSHHQFIPRDSVAMFFSTTFGDVSRCDPAGHTQYFQLCSISQGVTTAGITTSDLSGECINHCMVLPHFLLNKLKS